MVVVSKVDSAVVHRKVEAVPFSVELNKGDSLHNSHNSGRSQFYRTRTWTTATVATISATKPKMASRLKNKAIWRTREQTMQFKQYLVPTRTLVSSMNWDKYLWHVIELIIFIQLPMAKSSPSLTLLTKMVSNLKEIICQHLHQSQSNFLCNFFPSTHLRMSIFLHREIAESLKVIAAAQAQGGQGTLSTYFTNKRTKNDDF